MKDRRIVSNPFLDALLAGLIVCPLIYGIVCCGFAVFAPTKMGFPPTETLARRYLDAVIAGDIEAAVALAGSNPYCLTDMRKSATRHIAILRGTEVKNVQIDVQGGRGSDESLEFATIRFEYRISLRAA